MVDGFRVEGRKVAGYIREKEMQIIIHRMEFQIAIKSCIEIWKEFIVYHVIYICRNSIHNQKKSEIHKHTYETMS